MKSEQSQNMNNCPVYGNKYIGAIGNMETAYKHSTELIKCGTLSDTCKAKRVDLADSRINNTKINKIIFQAVGQWPSSYLRQSKRLVS